GVGQPALPTGALFSNDLSVFVVLMSDLGRWMGASAALPHEGHPHRLVHEAMGSVRRGLETHGPLAPTLPAVRGISDPIECVDHRLLLLVVECIRLRVHDILESNGLVSHHPGETLGSWQGPLGAPSISVHA